MSWNALLPLGSVSVYILETVSLFQRGPSILLSHQQYTMIFLFLFLFFSIPLVTLGVCAFYFILFFFKLEPLRYILPSHCGFLCCISQITDVEDLFVCLFVIYISSSVKNLVYFSHFVIGTFFLLNFNTLFTQSRY